MADGTEDGLLRMVSLYVSIKNEQSLHLICCLQQILYSSLPKKYSFCCMQCLGRCWYYCRFRNLFWRLEPQDRTVTALDAGTHNSLSIKPNPGLDLLCCVRNIFPVQIILERTDEETIGVECLLWKEDCLFCSNRSFIFIFLDIILMIEMI